MQNNSEICRTIKRNAEKCRKMQKKSEKYRQMKRNLEKCRKMQRNVEKYREFREMQRNSEKCRAFFADKTGCNLNEKLDVFHILKIHNSCYELAQFSQPLIVGCDILLWYVILLCYVIYIIICLSE